MALLKIHIFWQLYLIELLGFLIDLGLLELWHLIYLMISTGCSMLVFFTNLWDFWSGIWLYFVLCCLFSEIDGFKWLLMGSLHKNIQLTLMFLKALFWALHFYYYTTTNYLMMLSVVLLPMLKILLSTLSAVRHLICGSN